MSDLPPDLLDRSGRMRRLAIALVAAAVAGGVTYPIAAANIQDTGAAHVSARQMSGGTFVIYLTLAVTISVFIVTLGLLGNRAKRKWRESLDLPEARLKK
ncbi:MAG TPA: hypothetical protein VGM88_11105 [Kofleriaceae bacterium]|jgi:Na+/H+ antiporter NhaD/arsenite permease-like protein